MEWFGNSFKNTAFNRASSLWLHVLYFYMITCCVHRLSTSFCWNYMIYIPINREHSPISCAPSHLSPRQNARVSNNNFKVWQRPLANLRMPNGLALKKMVDVCRCRGRCKFPHSKMVQLMYPCILQWGNSRDVTPGNPETCSSKAIFPKWFYSSKLLVGEISKNHSARPIYYSQYRIVVLSCVASQDIAPLRLQQSGTRVANELQPQS